jgi:hypothetical protein
MKFDHKDLPGIGAEGRTCGGTNEFDVDQGRCFCKSR